MTAQGFPTVPAQYQQASGYTDNDLVGRHGCATCSLAHLLQRQRDVLQVVGRPAHLQDRHALRALGNDVLTGNTKPRVTVYWGQLFTNPDTGVTTKGTYGYYTLNQIGTIGNVNSNNYSFWLQDSWSPSARLTINGGVRFENELVPSYKDKTAVPRRARHQVRVHRQDRPAPRLRLRPQGRRQVEGLRAVRVLLRHDEAGTAARLVRRRPLDRLLLDAGQPGLLGHHLRRGQHGLPGQVPRLGATSATARTRPTRCSRSTTASRG